MFRFLKQYVRKEQEQEFSVGPLSLKGFINYPYHGHFFFGKMYILRVLD